MKDKLLKVLYKFDMSKEDCRIENAVSEILSLIRSCKPKKQIPEDVLMERKITYPEIYGWNACCDLMDKNIGGL